MISVSAIWVSVGSVSVVTAITVSVGVSITITMTVSGIAVVSVWGSISFGFTLVQLVDSMGGSWGADVLVAGCTG